MVFYQMEMGQEIGLSDCWGSATCQFWQPFWAITVALAMFVCDKRQNVSAVLVRSVKHYEIQLGQFWVKLSTAEETKTCI